MNYVVDITMNISNSKVKLVTNDESVTNGTYTQSTNNGYTEISLYIQPIDTIKYEEITIDFRIRNCCYYTIFKYHHKKNLLFNIQE